MIFDSARPCELMDHVVQVVQACITSVTAFGVAWLARRANRKDRVDAKRWREYDAQQKELLKRFGAPDY